MRFTSLKLKNFTVFKNAEFEFCEKVNVFVGANGTGKTHALKILYGLPLFGRDPQAHPSLGVLFYRDIFPKELISSSCGPDEHAHIVAYSENNGKWDVQIVDGGEIWAPGQAPPIESVPRPVFVPAIDMLAHTQRFLSTYDEYKIDFDRTHRDIVSLLLSPEKRNVDYLGIDLKEITGGAASDIEEQDERFYIKSDAGRFSAPMVAEGIRKFATVVQLIKNGWIRSGTTLMWDEPECSISPSLMGELVRTILTFANSGVQLFIATHNYELLKELDLQSKDGDVRYFALELVKNEAVVHPANSYDEIQPNKIAEEFDSIYDRQLKRATGRWRKNGGKG